MEIRRLTNSNNRSIISRDRRVMTENITAEELEICDFP